MNDLPDDLRALEANLSELVPANSLNADRLIFDAGYAAAIAGGKASATPVRAMVTIVGSASVGVAATLLAMFALQPDRPVPTQVDPIARITPQTVAASSLPQTHESSRVAVARSRWAPLGRSRSDAQNLIEPRDLAYSTLHWSERLLQSDGGWPDALEVHPIVLPGGGGIIESRGELPTNLQLQRELLRDGPSRERVNS